MTSDHNLMKCPINDYLAELHSIQEKLSENIRKHQNNSCGRSIGRENLQWNDSHNENNNDKKDVQTAIMTSTVE